jgi:hypothetical protein
VFSITLRPLYSREKSPQYPLDTRLGRPQNQSERRENKNHLFFLGLELRPGNEITWTCYGLSGKDDVCLLSRCPVSRNSAGVIAHACAKLERNMKLTEAECVTVELCPCRNKYAHHYGTNPQYPPCASHSSVILLTNTHICDISEDLLGYELSLGTELSEIRYVNSNISECCKVTSLISIN